MLTHSSIPRLGGIMVMLFSLACTSYSTQATPKNSQDVAPKRVKLELPKQPAPPRFVTTDKVAIKTSMGTLTVALYGKDAPKTVQNFLHYVDNDFYTGKIFHRIIDGFMIQAGGFDQDLARGETDDPINLELIPGLRHEPGVISMARQPNDIHSATTQFFICTTTAPQLNGTYAAFGKLLSGEDVLRAISQVPTHTVETEVGKMNDVPIKPVLIESISRL